MRCSETWLREWVNPNLSLSELCNKLTMSGLEVEEVVPVAANFTKVVVGEIVDVTKHSEADKLHICQVNVGDKAFLNIVCGASNVKPKMKVPVALIGAELPGNKKIHPTSIRNIPSEGMLCSAKELGLAEESQGLLELPADAPIGKDLRAYLTLQDEIIDLSITPNRGDCLSIKGVAREVSTLTGANIQQHRIEAVPAEISTKVKVKLEAPKACPRYVGRIIRNVKADAHTPIWMQERLRRAGVRSISPVVDVTNYVMLEIGQPMHAFDLETIKTEIRVRFAKKGESLLLLDGSEHDLTDDTLVIADAEKPLAIAGVMGGLSSSVTLNTKDVLLESAYFTPQIIASQRQYYQLNSDSAYRFERGIDAEIQRDAIERATQLILDFCGGEASEIVEAEAVGSLPQKKRIELAPDKITQTLGIILSSKKIEEIFTALNFNWNHTSTGWMVEVPTYRSDILLAEDLIEEIARIYGYNHIPEHPLTANLQIQTFAPNDVLSSLRHALCDQDFYEIISYSFVDKKIQQLLQPEEEAQTLTNPISSDMSVMRTTLWSGLLNTLLYNKARQQSRVRIFETGLCFIKKEGELQQIPKLSGLVMGYAYKEQWGEASQSVDFYDTKKYVENILLKLYPAEYLRFEPTKHPALHPGQTANIFVKDKIVGILGALHPTVLQGLDLEHKVFVFELDLNSLNEKYLVQFKDWSKYPEIRRDLAIIVDQAIPSEEIQYTIKKIAGDWLKDIFIFDVYQGKGIAPGSKSIALALILQHPTKTLVDAEVAELMDRIIAALKDQLGAELRS